MSHSAVTQVDRLRCTVLWLVSVILMVGCQSNRGAADEIQSSDRQQIKSSSFIGVNNAWLITANEGNLLFTKNGGRDWATVGGDAVGGKFESVGFVDDTHGLAVNSSGQIWKSANGGETWEGVAQLRSVKPIDWQFMSSAQILFADQLRAWIVEAFTIWRTDDGGNTWDQIYSVLNPDADGQPTSLHFVDRNTGWLVTSKGRSFQTVDGGTQWRVISLGKNVNAKDVVFATQQKGWAVASSSLPPYSKMYQTEDGGKTWADLPVRDPNTVIDSMSFLNDHEGWVAGRVWTGDQRTSSAVLLHTVDAGHNWQQIQLRRAEPSFYRVHFLDPQQGWLFARNNVYRTYDSGNNWQVVLTLPPTTSELGVH